MSVGPCFFVGTLLRAEQASRLVSPQASRRAPRLCIAYTRERRQCPERTHRSQEGSPHNRKATRGDVGEPELKAGRRSDKIVSKVQAR